MNGEPASCAVCERDLGEHEQRVCERCIQRTRDALVLVRDADLEPIIEATALHPGDLPGGRALVMAADGNDAALKPYPTRSLPTDRELDVPHGGLVGAEWCWLPYWEYRRPANGREHFADHWRSDPLVPIAVVESIGREWRKALGYEPDDQIRDVAGWCDWLLVRLRQATRLDSFPDDAETLKMLAGQVAATTGTINRPETATAKCFDCGADLISPYREPQWHDRAVLLERVAAQRHAEDTYGLLPTPLHLTRPGRDSEGREMAPPDENDPDAMPEPVWQCANRECARIYGPVTYRLAVSAAVLTEAEKAG